MPKQKTVRQKKKDGRDRVRSRAMKEEIDMVDAFTRFAKNQVQSQSRSRQPIIQTSRMSSARSQSSKSSRTPGPSSTFRSPPPSQIRAKPARSSPLLETNNSAVVPDRGLLTLKMELYKEFDQESTFSASDIRYMQTVRDLYGK